MENSQKNTPPISSHHMHFNLTEGSSPRAPPNYRSHSQVGSLITDRLANFTNLPPHSQHYLYKNNILHRELEYPLPQKNKDSYFDSNNEGYTKHLSKFGKFSKPYLECTKYTDELMRNRMLVRRALPNSFGLNSKKGEEISQTYKTSTQDTSKLMRKSHFRTFKRKKDPLVLRKKSQNLNFHLTVNNHIANYKDLMGKGLQTKKQEKSLKNSMDRVLTFEMIKTRLSTADQNFKRSISLAMKK